MAMRLRSLAPWFLLPPLLGVLLASWVVTWAIADEREESAALAGLALRDDVIGLAYSWVAAETSALIALDAFTELPSSFDWFVQSAAAWDGMDHDVQLDQLRFSDAEGPGMLAQVQVVGGAAPAVETVLTELDPAVFDDLADGRTGFLDPTPYAEAAKSLFDEMDTAGTRSEDATVTLGTLTERPAYWRNGTFLAFVLVLGLLAITGAVLALWRVSHGSRETTARLARAEARSEQLRQLISTARRLTAESDTSSLSRTLAGEARLLLGGDVATLVRRDGNRLEPVVVNGDLPVNAVTTGDGVVGRCAETGLVSRTVVASDPFFPGSTGAVAVLAAPLVADGLVIGALVVASRTTTMFDESDEASLQLLALVGAGAVTAAQRYDSTVALALRDPLTGLANRRRLDHDLATSAVAEEQVAFLMIDIDHFKAFNDAHGHQRGDDLLRIVAGAIAGAVRDGDVVYRYGGEEFSVLLPGADTPTAAGVGERVRAAVIVATAGMIHPTTVSVGVAAQVAPVTPALLVERADAALYAAKQAGRDRVALASAPDGGRITGW
jgi:diguanylate cyclase (GGDEF)-like protein